MLYIEYMATSYRIGPLIDGSVGKKYIFDFSFSLEYGLEQFLNPSRALTAHHLKFHGKLSKGSSSVKGRWEHWSELKRG